MKSKKLIILFLFSCIVFTCTIIESGVKAQEAQDGADEGDEAVTSEIMEQVEKQGGLEFGKDGLPNPVGEDNKTIYENLNYWIAFVGPDAPTVMEVFPDFIGIRAEGPDGSRPLFRVDVAIAKGELESDAQGHYYYKPYIAEKILKNDGDMHYVVFNIRGKVPNTFTAKNGLDYKYLLGEPVKEDEQVEDITNNSVIYMPYEYSDTFTCEAGTKKYTFVAISGGHVSLDGNREVGILKAYEQVYQPKLEVNFVGGAPQPFTLDIKRTRDNDASIFGQVSVKLKNSHPENKYELYEFLWPSNPYGNTVGSHRSKIDLFRMADTDADYCYQGLNLFDITLPEIDNFTKNIETVGTPENGYHWVVTYTAKTDKKYTLSFDLAGGMYNGQTETYYIKANDGETITLPAPTRTNHTFSHWEGSKYYAGDSYTVTGDHDFVAVWEAEPTPTNTSDTLPTVTIPIVTNTQPSEDETLPNMTVIQPTASSASVPSDDITHAIQELPSTGQSSGMSVVGAGLLILASTAFAVNSILNKQKGHK